MNVQYASEASLLTSRTLLNAVVASELTAAIPKTRLSHPLPRHGLSPPRKSSGRMRSTNVAEDDRKAGDYSPFGLAFSSSPRRERNEQRSEGNRGSNGDEAHNDEDDALSSASTLRYDRHNPTQDDWAELSDRASTEMGTNRFSGLYSLNSSHSWGDEMGDYDREASRIVHELFSGINSILFENVHQKTEHGKYSVQLKQECSDWSTRFPHLRVLGSQVCESCDNGYRAYPLGSFHEQPFSDEPPFSDTPRTVVSVFSSDDQRTSTFPSPLHSIPEPVAPLEALSADSLCPKCTTLQVFAPDAHQLDQFSDYCQNERNDSTDALHLEEVLVTEGLFEEVIAVDGLLSVEQEARKVPFVFCRYEERADQLAKLTADPQMPIPWLRDRVLQRLFAFEWTTFAHLLRPLCAEFINRNAAAEMSAQAEVPLTVRQNEAQAEMGGKAAAAISDRTQYSRAQGVSRMAAAVMMNADFTLFGSQMLPATPSVTQRDGNATESNSMPMSRVPLPAVPENKAMSDSIQSILHIKTKPVQLREKSNLSSGPFSDGLAEASASSTARPDSSLPTIAAHRFRPGSRLGSAQYPQYLPKHHVRLAPLQLGVSQGDRRANLTLNLVGHASTNDLSATGVQQPRRLRDSMRSGSANVPPTYTKERALTGVLTVNAQTPLVARERSVSLAPNAAGNTSTEQLALYQSPQHSFVSVSNGKEKAARHNNKGAKTTGSSGTSRPEPSRSDSPAPRTASHNHNHNHNQNQNETLMNTSMSNFLNSAPNANANANASATIKSSANVLPARNATHLHHSTFSVQAGQQSTTQTVSRNPGHFGITGNSIALNNRLLFSGSVNGLSSLDQPSMAAADNAGGASVPLIRRSKATVPTLR